MKEAKQFSKQILKILFLCTVFLVIGMGAGKTAQAADKHPYYIKVNKKMNTVTIYKKDKKGNYTKPVKAMVCATGKSTPTGTFKTPVKYRWRPLIHNTWGQYATRITGSFLFHSVYYTSKDPSTLSIDEYNKLGTSASAGCVRLTVADAKWIYDNCAIGTKVTIYNSNDPGPLGKPKSIKISKYSWDPTDTGSKNNPWNKKKPTIKGTSNKELLAGGTLDLKKGVKAYDTCGNDITKTIKIDKSKLNLKKAGTYKVTYSVTDLLNRKATKTINVKVINPSEVTFKGVKNQTFEYDKYKNKKLNDYVMKGVSATSAGYKIDAKYLSYTSKVVKNDATAMVYEITYAVKNPTNNQKTTKTVTFTLKKK